MAEFKMGSAFVEVGLRDNTTADEARIRGRLSRVKVSVPVDLDTKLAEAKQRALEAKLAKLRALQPSPEVDLKIAQAEASLAKIKAELASLRDKRVEVDVDTGRSIS